MPFQDFIADLSFIDRGHSEFHFKGSENLSKSYLFTSAMPIDNRNTVKQKNANSNQTNFPQMFANIIKASATKQYSQVPLRTVKTHALQANGFAE